MQKYGRLATHDVHVPVLLAYELGNIQDKNGTPVNINKDFINRTMKLTNDWIIKKHRSPFARFRSAWNKPIEDVQVIPIIKNHDTTQVDNTVGWIKGLLYTQEVDGILSLYANAVITDPDAKLKVEGDLLRNTSFGTRGDGSIKELSFVINEAIPHGGLVCSEPNNVIETSEPKTKSTEEIQLAEEISELQFEEQQLNEVIIPNHIVLSRMIRTGKIYPWQYDNLITENNQHLLQLMEQSLPSTDLGLMLGTQRHPEKRTTDDNRIVKSIIDKYKKENPSATASKVKHKPEIDGFIKESVNFEETREKELKYILELAEHSPDIAKKYIQAELGNGVEDVDTSRCFAEYLARSKELKQLINTKQIQLGEYNE